MENKIKVRNFENDVGNFAIINGMNVALKNFPSCTKGKIKYYIRRTRSSNVGFRGGNYNKKIDWENINKVFLFFYVFLKNNFLKKVVNLFCSKISSINFSRFKICSTKTKYFYFKK
jgi:hypothetical protein